MHANQGTRSAQIKITRRVLIHWAATAAFIPVHAWAASPAVVVHKDPNCGCCSGWVEHLESNGFRVQVLNTAELDRVKTRLQVPSDLQACHTAEVENYVIEGHVPAAALKRFLTERPQALRRWGFPCLECQVARLAWAESPRNTK
jgi:hypothetical protein